MIVTEFMDENTEKKWNPTIMPTKYLWTENATCVSFSWNGLENVVVIYQTLGREENLVDLWLLYRSWVWLIMSNYKDLIHNDVPEVLDSAF